MIVIRESFVKNKKIRKLFSFRAHVRMFSLAAFYSQLFIHNFYAKLAQKFHFLEAFIYFITRINLSRTRGLLTDELRIREHYACPYGK